jgi:hypothetical protein
MSNATLCIEEPSSPEPRLLEEERSSVTVLRERGGHPSEDCISLLIAGADPLGRARMRDELARSMSQGTVFEEAGTFAEVLERAPASRILILSGPLDDVPARSLMRILGHHHPKLPVVSLGASATAVH